MSEEPTLPLAQLEAEVVNQTAESKAGWVKSVADGRFHEVEDVDVVLQAYPGQYEKCKASEVKKNLVGWPKADGSNEA